MSRAEWRPDLLALLRDCDIELTEADDDTSLISTGTLDSLGLYRLVEWVESQLGRPVDPATVDLAREWDSVNRILDFLARNDAAPQPVAAAATSAPPVQEGRVRAHGAGIEIRRFTSADRDAVAHLQTGLWGPDPARNLHYLEWKHERNPWSAQPNIYLAFEGEELVAMRSFYGACWELGPDSRQHEILVADDALVRADRRNKALMRTLMESALEDLSARGARFVFNLSGGPVTVLDSRAAGWRSAGTLESIRRRSLRASLRSASRERLRALPLLWRAAGHPLLREAAASEQFDRASGAFLATDGRRIEHAASARPGPMAELVRRIGHDGRIRHLRDARWFDWRYSNPLAQYRFLYAGGAQLDGYLVLRCLSGNGNSAAARIADLEAIDQGTRVALLEAATAPGLVEELQAWSATLRHTELEQLARAGFRPLSAAHTPLAERCILVRSTAATAPEPPWQLDGIDLLALPNWDLRMSYAMTG